MLRKVQVAVMFVSAGLASCAGESVDQMVQECRAEVGNSPTQAAWLGCMHGKERDVTERQERIEAASLAVSGAVLAGAAAQAAQPRPAYVLPPPPLPARIDTTCQNFGLTTNCTSTAY